MATNPKIQSNPVRTVHVEGRTPGALGIAPMVTVQDGAETSHGLEGSQHQAVYLGVIIAISEALSNGETHLTITTPSHHVVNQVPENGWETDPKLVPFRDIIRILKTQIVVTIDIAPRTIG